MTKRSQKTVEITDEEINELAGYIVEAIRNDYVKIDEYYHWPESDYYYLDEKFQTFNVSSVGLKQTLDLREKTEKLWALLCERGDERPLRLSEEDYLSIEPELSPTEKGNAIREEVTIDRKWFVALVVKKWGGIHSYKSEDKCIEFFDKHLKGNRDKVFSADDFLPLGGSVSSWSKFLTFALPKQFEIFDSRVAFRLNTIIADKFSSTGNVRTEPGYKSVEPYLNKYYFYQPVSRSGDPCSIRKLEKRIGQTLQLNGNSETITRKYCESYAKYLRVIKAIADILQRDNIGGARGLSPADVRQKVEMTLFSNGRIMSKEVLSRYKKMVYKNLGKKNIASNEFSRMELVNAVLERLSESK